MFDSYSIQESSSPSSSSSECSAQGQVFHSKFRHQGCSSAQRQIFHRKTKVIVLLEMNRSGSFALLSALHSVFIIWADLKRSEKIPGVPSWKWGEWIWLTGPSGLHRNSPQGLNSSSIRVFDHIRDPEIPITLLSLNKFNYSIILTHELKQSRTRLQKQDYKILLGFLV